MDTLAHDALTEYHEGVTELLLSPSDRDMVLLNAFNSHLIDCQASARYVGDLFQAMATTSNHICCKVIGYDQGHLIAVSTSEQHGSPSGLDTLTHTPTH